MYSGPARTRIEQFEVFITADDFTRGNNNIYVDNKLTFYLEMYFRGRSKYL